MIKGSMDNKTAIFVAAVIIGFLALDYFYVKWNAPVFIEQKLALLIEYMAVWR